MMSVGYIRIFLCLSTVSLYAIICLNDSSKRLECGKYIDEDAMYCMNCIDKVADQIIGDYSN